MKTKRSAISPSSSHAMIQGLRAVALLKKKGQKKSTPDDFDWELNEEAIALDASREFFRDGSRDLGRCGVAGNGWADTTNHTQFERWCNHMMHGSFRADRLARHYPSPKACKREKTVYGVCLKLKDGNEPRKFSKASQPCTTSFTA